MNSIKHIVNFLLAITILVSSIGIPENKHYCMDRLKDVRLFSPAIPCDYENLMAIETCPTTTDPANKSQSKGCCHDTHEIVKLNNIQNSFSHFELVKLYPVSSIIFAPYISELNYNTQPAALLYSHSPPLIQPDKSIVYHSLLI